MVLEFTNELLPRTLKRFKGTPQVEEREQQIPWDALLGGTKNWGYGGISKGSFKFTHSLTVPGSLGEQHCDKNVQDLTNSHHP